MNCPACRTALRMSERVGVEIDFCPNCRGVWLDRGELDKILDRSPEVPRGLYEREEMYEHDEHAGHDARSRSPSRAGPPPSYESRRKKSFLRELFDFD